MITIEKEIFFETRWTEPSEEYDICVEVFVKKGRIMIAFVRDCKSEFENLIIVDYKFEKVASCHKLDGVCSLNLKDLPEMESLVTALSSRLALIDYSGEDITSEALFEEEDDSYVRHLSGVSLGKDSIAPIGTEKVAFISYEGEDVVFYDLRTREVIGRKSHEDGEKFYFEKIFCERDTYPDYVFIMATPAKLSPSVVDGWYFLCYSTSSFELLHQSLSFYEDFAFDFSKTFTYVRNYGGSEPNFFYLETLGKGDEHSVHTVEKPSDWEEKENNIFVTRYLYGKGCMIGVDHDANEVAIYEKMGEGQEFRFAGKEESLVFVVKNQGRDIFVCGYLSGDPKSKFAKKFIHLVNTEIPMTDEVIDDYVNERLVYIRDFQNFEDDERVQLLRTSLGFTFFKSFFL